jgi:hypothetical protein
MMICDWCGEKYPISYSDYKNIHQLKNYANKPIVCNACYKKIKQTDALKIFTHSQIYQKPIEIKLRTKT